MITRRSSGYLALCALLVLCGCGMPTLSSGSLADQTMTYTTAYLGTDSSYVPNGHDTISFIFDSTGRAGTFEETDYYYGYSTQADVTADVYANSVWFQNGGFKGTFTYNSATCSLSMSVTEQYAPKAGATPIIVGPPDIYAAASYEYQAIATVFGTEKARYDYSTNMMFTVDSLQPVLRSNAAAWQATSVTSMTRDIAGVLTSEVATTVTTATITADAITANQNTTDVVTASGTSTTTTTAIEASYTVLKFSLIGQSDTAGLTFANAWKYGNEVSFQLNMTHLTYIGYEGDTAPAEPAVDPATGTGMTGLLGIVPFYYVSTTVTPAIMEYAHQGSYIVNLDQIASAVRGILPR
jgi:hypothetical protein